MASKEKVDIKRSDQFQEMDEELTRAMEELDSTIDRISSIFQSNSQESEAPLLAEDGPADELPAGHSSPAVDEEAVAQRSDESE